MQNSSKKPLKRWGQHFLKDKNIAAKIANSISPSTLPMVVMEIGPGKGILTEFLVKKADAYIGVEIDSSLAKELEETYGHQSEVRFISKDFLQISIAEYFLNYPDSRHIIVGNIPYNITSPILFKIYEDSDIIDEAILMMQKEVAERMVAPPSTKAYGLLAIFSQLFAEVKLLFTVPPHLFYPPPKVDSAVVKLRLRQQVKEQFADFTFFQKVLRHCFQHRRKMLRKSLSMLFSAELLSKLSADLTQRPEQLSIDDWKQLIDHIYLEMRKDRDL
ncbi:MAG: ribosomal RNA small subunit methyltransferase A [Calditrichaeota bacterium]|nr:MAG: ribosomal RNA small subunit methyltransferase A [Calditrichota bacterium]